MKADTQLLSAALVLARRHGPKTPPDRLLKVVSELDNPIAAVNYDSGRSLFGALEQDFGFIRHNQHPDNRISTQNFERLVGLIRWLVDELKQYYRQEPPNEKLVVYLTTAAFIDQGRLFWRELPLPREHCLGFFAALSRVVGGSCCSYNTRGTRVPIWELEACERFKKADAEKDFVTIDSLWTPFENALISNFLLRQSALCLFYNDFQTLISSSGKIEQMSVASWVVDALPSTARFCLGLLSESPWVRFASIYCTVRHRRQCGFRPSAHRLLVLALEKLAQDNEAWGQAMLVFNKYPVRYPALQLALGQSLTRVPVSACNAYVDAISVSKIASGRNEIAACLRAFRTDATTEKRQALFSRIFHRWVKVMENKNEEYHHHEPFITELDYGVVAYLVNFSDSDVVKETESICAKIGALDLSWHVDESDCITAFNMLLSRLQPYYQALHIHKVGGDLLTTKIRIPTEIAGDRYIHLMFHFNFHRGPSQTRVATSDRM